MVTKTDKQTVARNHYEHDDPATGEWLRSHQEPEDRTRQLEAQMRRHGITPGGD